MSLTKRDAELLVGINPLPALLSGPAFTLLNSKDIVGVGGVAILWRGVGEAWVIPSCEAKKFPVSLHKTVKKMLDMIQDCKKLHRVQASVKEDFEKGHRWIKTMGFKREGRMIGYGPNGENFIRYARTRKWHS